MPTLTIQPIEAFSDNYIWLIHNQSEAFVVDPGDARVVTKALKENLLRLGGILITHHHFDHVGGVDTLRQDRDIPIYGPDNTPYEGITHPVTEGDKVDVLGHIFTVLTVPGHTLDHIAYVSEENNTLFCGDTLFAGGCGRLFEGTPEQMYHSLNKLKALKPEIEVYCAHEYTLANLSFAKAVDKDNTSLLQRIEREQQKRADNQPTVPTTIKLECQTNPFLRSDDPDITQSASAHCQRTLSNPIEVLAAVRAWKDQF